MPDSLYQQPEKKAWAIVTFLFIAYVTCSIAFSVRSNVLGCGNEALDGRSYSSENTLFSPYTTGDIECLFKRLKGQEIEIFSVTITKLTFYALTEISLDVLFPLIYVSLLAFLMIRIFSAEKNKYLIWVPILAGIFDLLENITIIYLAFTFVAEQPSKLASLAPVFTELKLTLILSSLVILLFGSIPGLWKGDKSVAETA